jgi:hypothetical protein
MVQPVIVPAYGIIAYPFSPVVIAEPAPSIVIPNEPDKDPGLKSPEKSAYEDELEKFAKEDEMEVDAKDEDVELDDDMAKDDVPCKSPIKLPLKEPVLYVWVNVSKLEDNMPMLELLLNMRVSKLALSCTYEDVNELKEEVKV